MRVFLAVDWMSKIQCDFVSALRNIGKLIYEDNWLEQGEERVPISSLILMLSPFRHARMLRNGKAP